MLKKIARQCQLSCKTSLAFILSATLLSACTDGGSSSGGGSSSSDSAPASGPTYRLTTSFKGDDQALSVVDIVDETANEDDPVPAQLRLSAVADVPQQSWKFTKLDDGRFTISNLSIGDSYSMDVVNDGVFDRVKMAPTANVSGQYWTITPKSNGYCQLTNSFTGNEMALDIRNEGDQDEPMLAPIGDFSGQSWRFTVNNNSTEIDEDLMVCSEM